MKKAWQNFITQFKPKYRVEAHNYHLVPFSMLQTNSNSRDFEKGEYEAARKYYDKVVMATTKAGVAPAEVFLIKGKKSVVHSASFGPVAHVKKFQA
ncbi:MAG: hypothetical protein AAGC88_11550 [Bacteroidota bacterium]